MKDERMGTKKILPLLVEFSIPTIIGMSVNAIYNIVDRIFIGNVLGSLGLAGVTVTFPVTLALMALSLMVGVGGATKFSISLGAGQRDEAKKYMGNAFVLTIFFGLLFMLGGNLFMEPLLNVLGASSNVYSYASDYLSIILFGAVFQCVAMYGNNFSRAQGNPRNAMISQLIGAGFNILFDYILIVQLGMGMKGAALATIGGQLLSAIYQLTFLVSKRTIIKLTLEAMTIKFTYLIRIIQTGIPAFLMQISNTFLNIVLNKTLATYGGDIALSAVGIITSFQTLLLMPLTGLAQGQQPLISYNFGARKYDRVKETLKYAIIGATIISFIGFSIVELFPEAIIRMFNNEKEVIALAIPAIRIWFICLFVDGCQIMCANYFQAIGHISKASLLNSLRQVILLIPLVLILPNIMGLYGVFVAVPIADMGAFIITDFFIVKAIKQL